MFDSNVITTKGRAKWPKLDSAKVNTPQVDMTNKCLRVVHNNFGDYVPFFQAVQIWPDGREEVLINDIHL